MRHCATARFTVDDTQGRLGGATAGIRAEIAGQNLHARGDRIGASFTVSGAFTGW